MRNVWVHLWVATANKAISPMIDRLQSARVIYVLFLSCGWRLWDVQLEPHVLKSIFLLLTHEFSSPFIIIAPLSKRNPACEHCGCLGLQRSAVSWLWCFLIGWSASLAIKLLGFFVFNDFREFREMREINYSECCVRVTAESNSSDNTENTKKNKPRLI